MLLKELVGELERAFRKELRRVVKEVCRDWADWFYLEEIQSDLTANLKKKHIVTLFVAPAKPIVDSNLNNFYNPGTAAFQNEVVRQMRAFQNDWHRVHDGFLWNFGSILEQVISKGFHPEKFHKNAELSMIISNVYKWFKWQNVRDTLAETNILSAVQAGSPEQQLFCTFRASVLETLEAFQMQTAGLIRDLGGNVISGDTGRNNRTGASALTDSVPRLFRSLVEGKLNSLLSIQQVAVWKITLVVMNGSIFLNSDSMTSALRRAEMLGIDIEIIINSYKGKEIMDDLLKDPDRLPVNQVDFFSNWYQLSERFTNLTVLLTDLPIIHALMHISYSERTGGSEKELIFLRNYTFPYPGINRSWSGMDLCPTDSAFKLYHAEIDVIREKSCKLTDSYADDLRKELEEKQKNEPPLQFVSESDYITLVRLSKMNDIPQQMTIVMRDGSSLLNPRTEGGFALRRLLNRGTRVHMILRPATGDDKLSQPLSTSDPFLPPRERIIEGWTQMQADFQNLQVSFTALPVLHTLLHIEYQETAVIKVNFYTYAPENAARIFSCIFIPQDRERLYQYYLEEIGLFLAAVPKADGAEEYSF